MLLPDRKHRYRTLVCDSKRWSAFEPRDGDIIVATPAKCGTTWTQMICALIVFRGENFPRPLNELSPWLDAVFEPVETVLARLAAQPHRRIIKTHTPLSALPYYSNVSYVVVGRDPRDAFLSFQDHRRNTTPEAVAKLFELAGIAPFDIPDDPENGFKLWATTGDQPWTKDGFPTGSVLSHLESFWAFRHLPNLQFVHYADLVGDREGEMRRIAAFLNETIPKPIWPDLVCAASLEAMRAAADRLAPAAGFAGGNWRDNRAFFKEARNRAWRTALSAANQALYLDVSRKAFDADLLAWAEGGRAATSRT